MTQGTDQTRDNGGQLWCATCPARELDICRGLAQENERGSVAPLLHSLEKASVSRSVIFRKNEHLEYVPIVCSGWAVNTAILSNGRRMIVSVLLSGDLVSTALIFDPAIRFAVEAITDVRYRVFPRHELQAVLQKNMEKLFQVLIEEKMQLDRLIVDLGRHTASARIARLVLDIFSRLAQRNLTRDNAFDFPLRHHHIADATGLTPVHVSRTLTEFRNKGLIDIKERSITILDLSGFRAVAQAG